jgi:hypothetical protein
MASWTWEEIEERISWTWEEVPSKKQDTKACRGNRRQERREDSDDAGVRGQVESPKDSPNIFFLGGAHGVVARAEE